MIPNSATQNNLESQKRVVYSVTIISKTIKEVIEGSFNHIFVKGEISNPKMYSSGHTYFSLKENDVLLECIIWRNTKLTFAPEHGAEVICEGRITTYAGRSRYQMIVQSVEHAGIGSLLKILEERKRKLQQEGLFDAKYKLALPKYPRRIALITSKSGAVLHDMLHRLEERFPCDVKLYSTHVQGANTANEIISILQSISLDTFSPDVIIIARGGGSIEDLWEFNDEKLIRAVVASSIPIVTAIGHETDTTLVDYASSLRAPTPTAAIEMITPNRFDILQMINQKFAILKSKIQYILSYMKHTLTLKSKVLSHRSNLFTVYNHKLHKIYNRYLHNKSLYIERIQKIPIIAQPSIHKYITKLNVEFSRYKNLCEKYYLSLERNLSLQNTRLQSYSYQKTLQRGFSIVQNSKNKLITSKKDAQKETNISITFADGSCNATLLNND